VVRRLRRRRGNSDGHDGTPNVSVSDGLAGVALARRIESTSRSDGHGDGRCGSRAAAGDGRRDWWLGVDRRSDGSRMAGGGGPDFRGEPSRIVGCPRL